MSRPPSPEGKSAHRARSVFATTRPACGILFAAFAQAIEDALGLDGFEVLEIPLSPGRLFELVEAHRGGTEDPS